MARAIHRACRFRWNHVRWISGKWQLHKWELTCLDHNLLARIDGRLPMRIDPEDYLQRHVFVTGRWEDETTQLVRALLKPGDSFVDVGAHVGYFTLLAADALQYGGRVHAFEPVPRSFELLENNVRSNESARRATPERVARSSTPSARAAVRMERVEHETLSEVMS